MFLEYLLVVSVILVSNVLCLALGVFLGRKLWKKLPHRRR